MLKQIDLQPVEVLSGVTIGVHPKVMRDFGLRPGQLVDAEMVERILEANAQARREDEI